MTRLSLSLPLVAVLFAASLHAAAAGSGYKLIREIPVGGEGGWDYLSVDSAARRLYVSHATHIAVVDLTKGAVVGDIGDTPGVHGIALAPDLHLGFSTNGREARSSEVDLLTLKTTTKVATGEGPDGSLYDATRHEVYTFNGRGQSATVIDATSGKVVATIALPGKPEAGAIDGKAGRVYVNIEDAASIAVIDTAAHKVVANWSIAPGESATGLAIDTATHRLFAVCENQLMVMLDSSSGKFIASVPIGARTDGLVFDSALRLAFASNGEGSVTIAHEDSPGKLSVVQTLVTQPGARTIALDPATHRIYLPVATMQAAAAGAGGRGTPVPDSFRVIEYGQD